MEKWIHAIFSTCADPSREKEFNEWYNNVHLPDILKTPGIKKATRYEVKGAAGGEAKFIALYEIETDDIEKTMAADKENVSKMRAQGRMSELCKVVQRTLSRQIFEMKK